MSLLFRLYAPDDEDACIAIASPRLARATMRIEMNTSQHTVAFYERFGFERTGEFEEDGYGPGLHKIGMARPSSRLP